MADHENGSETPSTGNFLKSLTVTFQGWGDTPKAADDAMLDTMNKVNRLYQRGERVTDTDLFQIEKELDPGGGGPGYLRVADVYLPGRKGHDD